MWMHTILTVSGWAFAGAATLASALITCVVSSHRPEMRRFNEIFSYLHELTNPEKIYITIKELIADNDGSKYAKIFTTKELTEATDNFSKHNLLGSGSFGNVFKGSLIDDTLTAIKCVKFGEPFYARRILNEVRILRQVNHRSIIRLLGFCVEIPFEPLAVYEFVPNDTLSDHLRNPSGHRHPLRWRRRLIIAYQTALGLAYLHDFAVPRIIHGDIKASNILLDDSLNAKIADFGFAKFATSKAEEGVEEDVHMFGVVLLELLTTMDLILDFGNENKAAIELILEAVGKGRLMEVVDPTVKEGAGKAEVESLKAAGRLAAECLDDRRKKRLAMKDVANQIEHILEAVSDGVKDDVSEASL